MINRHLINYIDTLKAQQSNLSFSNHSEDGNSSPFQKIMFLLLQKIFSFEDDSNYQIIICDTMYETDILSDIILCTALTKYFNTTHHALPKVEKGDILYKYEGSDEFEILGTIENSIRCKKRNPKKNEGDSYINIRQHQINSYILIPKKEDFTWNKNTLKKRFKAYLDFFKKYKPEKVDFKPLTKFDAKTLIIASSKVKDDLADIPYRYKGTTSNLPIEPMIELVNNWEEAKEILEQDDKIQEVIIIGKNKYQDNINDIINFKNSSDTLQKIILIGDKKADTSASFYTWHWTLEELWLLYNIKNPFNFKRESIKDDFLKTSLKLIKEIEDTIVTEGVLKSDAQKIFRSLLIPFLATLKNIDNQEGELFLDKIKDKLEDYNSNFQIICDNANIKTEKKEKYKEKILDIFERIINCLKLSNRKLDYCKQLHINNYMQYKIVCPKADTDLLNENFKRENIRRTKAISIKELEDIVLGKSNIDNEVKVCFVFPYIYLKYDNPSWYYYVLQKARTFGYVILLEYDDIEKERNNVFTEFYEREKDKRLTSEDRLKFVDITFEYKKQVLNLETNTKEIINSENAISSEIEQNKDFFAQYWFFDEDIKTSREVTEILDGEAYHEKERKNTISLDRTKYKISLNNGSEIECYITDFLVIPSGNSFVKKQCNSLQGGESIVYFDINFENCFEVLKKIEDKSIKEILSKIVEASREWRKWLKDIIDMKTKKRGSKVAEAEDEVYEKINLSVAKSTFLSWITDKHDYFFPRSNDDLKAILDYYVKLKSKEEKTACTERAEYILSLKRKNTGLREIVTKLNIELGQYICDKTIKPKLAILSKLNDTQIKELTKTKQIVKIKEIVKP